MQGDVALLLLRAGLGAIFIVHGREKRKFWKMQPSAQLPAGLLRTLRFLSIAEPAGGLAVLVGFLTQPAALGLALVMLGALRSSPPGPLSLSRAHPGSLAFVPPLHSCGEGAECAVLVTCRGAARATVARWTRYAGSRPPKGSRSHVSSG